MRPIFAYMTTMTVFSGLCDGAHVKMEKLKERIGLSRKNRANAELDHEVIFHVKQLNMDVLEQIVAERSSPSHAKYQTWLSFEEIGSLTSNTESAQKVIVWLNDNQIEVNCKIKIVKYPSYML